jgi:hypothetical protein
MKSILILTSSILFSYISAAQVTLTTSKLPIVKINTLGNTIVDDPKIIAHISIINNIGINNVSDSANDLKSYIAIEVRGSSSQSFPKKNYGFELRDSLNTNNNVKKPLLGMPKESDWILYGPYTDKTFVRDVLTHRLFSKMGHYGVRCKFVELLINNNYEGVYVAMEKIKRDSNRVDISKMTTLDNAGTAVTGGYLLKIDKTTGAFTGGFGSAVNTYLGQPKNLFYQYDYPKSPTSSQQSYIQSYVDSFEQATLSSTWLDSSIGYRKYININSFIDFYLLNELSHNVDGYRLSTYLHKKKITSGDGKIHMGPVWDFNLAYGNADYCNGWQVDSWALDQPCDQADYPFWWKRILLDTTYVNKLKCRYTQFRSGILSNANIMNMIDSMTASIDTAATNRNYTKWPILSTYVWPNYEVGNSFMEEIDSVKSWINQRLVWMDANMPGNLNNCLLPLPVQFISVNAIPINSVVKVSWSTAAEIQNDYFEVERSNDAYNFVRIEKVFSKAFDGNSSIELKYDVIDEKPLLGKNYYRIKQIDRDGRKVYSNIVSHLFNIPFTALTYPSPCNDVLNIDIASKMDESCTLNIVDITGKTVHNEKIKLIPGTNYLKINVSTLQTGTYYAQFINNNLIKSTSIFAKK